jgi:hypothetical protein
MRTTVSLLALSLVALPLGAQQHADHDRPVQGTGNLPTGWSARTDNGGPLTNLKYEVMAPGWHLTTGPSSILYREADRAEGAVHAVAKLHVFPSSGHHEGFGLIMGGQNLTAENVAYTYFLIRGDGKYLIKRRNGTDVSTLVNWTDSDAIVKAKQDGPVVNELSFEAGRDSVAFMVNGKTVHTVPASQVDTKGIVGLRANHNLSLHVESLAVHPR